MKRLSPIRPATLNYNYNYGIYAIGLLSLQIVTGIILAMFYTPNASLAFLSIEHIMRDVPYGWLIRYTHANGASFFFIAVYVHMLRGMIYGSYFYPRRLLWLSGVLILLLMIITAFLGYVLPWGQMSYWAATVITNLASTVPFFGQKIVNWLWSGFSVDNPTLSKFFSLHYVLPFLILAMVMIHLALLHKAGSTMSQGWNRHIDQIPFHPYYTLKDLYSTMLFFTIVIYFIVMIPNNLGHPDNYIPANPDQTPEHIVPEWYFLPFYAILRSIPNKLLGVIALVMSIVALILLPLLSKPFVRSSKYKPFTFYWTMLFIANCIILGYIGQSPLEEPYLTIGRISTVFYFTYFALLSLMDYIDKRLLNKIKVEKAKIVKESRWLNSPWISKILAIHASWILTVRSYFLIERPNFFYIIGSLFVLNRLFQIIPSIGLQEMAFTWIWLGLQLILYDTIGSMYSYLYLQYPDTLFNRNLQAILNWIDNATPMKCTAWTAFIFGKTAMSSTGRAAMFVGVITTGGIFINNELQRRHESLEAQLSRDFQAHQNQLSRDFQAHQNQLSRDLEAHQNQLSRDLEREKLAFERQKWEASQKNKWWKS